MIRSLWILGIVLISLPAEAHRMGLARVVIDPGTPHQVRVALNPQAAKHQLRPTLPSQCTVARPWHPQGDALHWQSAWTCSAPLQQLHFTTRGAYEGTVLVRYTTHHGAAIERVSRGGAPIHFELQDRAQTPLTGHFLGGLLHLALGWDHLLLIALIALQLGPLRQVVHATLAFTAGHTVSLLCTAVGLVRLPIPPVEACIALSLVLMAWMALRSRDQAQPISLSLLGLFGLLHGLGLASGFSSSGLEGFGLLAAVLVFNLGVEAAQVVWLVALRVTQRTLPLPPRLGHDGVAYAAGICAVFWLIQRSTELGGA